MSTETATAAHDEEHGDAEDHWQDEGHWTDLQFVYLAIGLAIITALEVALSYIDVGPIFIPALLILMAIKFFSVVLYFMHLRFDSQWFSMLFYMGLVLAVSVYIVMLLTFLFFVG